MRFTNKPAKFFALKLPYNATQLPLFTLKAQSGVNCLINAELSLLFYLKKFINLPLYIIL
jgi:hypothetical protein